MKHCIKCNELNLVSSVNCKNCSSSLENAINLLDYIRLEDRPRFKFIEFLGEGSFGRVYKCQDNKLQKIVALKLIKKECVSNNIFLELFKRECEFSKNIGEEHLITTLDYFVSDKLAYSVMEFFDGIDLDSFLKNKLSITLDEFKKIAIQIANGLHFFHYHGLIHCDLKPSNIMINPQTLKLKIIDFGLSHFKFEENILEKNMVGGTRGYMSPEQASGTKALTNVSDIYSVGVIYYEMLTGILPKFNSNNEAYPPSNFCDVLLGNDENSLTEANNDLDNLIEQALNIINELDLIILQCLKHEPKLRYKSIEELNDKIQKLGNDFPLQIIIEKSEEALKNLKTNVEKVEKYKKPNTTLIKPSTSVTQVLENKSNDKMTSKTLILEGIQSHQQIPNENLNLTKSKPNKVLDQDLSHKKTQRKGTVYKENKQDNKKLINEIINYTIFIINLIIAGVIIYYVYLKLFQ